MALGNSSEASGACAVLPRCPGNACADAKVSFAQHFAGFDPEGFSIWFCDYKYPEENTVNYIVMNKARACLHLLACTKVSAAAVWRIICVCNAFWHASQAGECDHPGAGGRVPAAH